MAHIEPDWLYHILDWPFNQTGGYPFFSGIGLAVFFPVVYYWHHRCHRTHCWRWGHPDPHHGHPRCRQHANIDPPGGAKNN